MIQGGYIIMKQIKLTQDEFNLLNNKIKGQGGFQSLQQKLLSKVDDQLKITLDDNDIERICRYIKDYGTGGAQTQFLNIFRNYLPCL
jgi:hypothetical protein